MWLTSKHGQLYSDETTRAQSPTCVTCHMPSGSHDTSVGLGLGNVAHGAALDTTKPPVKMRQISAGESERQREAMLSTCLPCHSSRFSTESLSKADLVKVEANQVLAEAVAIIEQLHIDGLLKSVSSQGRSTNHVATSTNREPPLVLGGDQLYEGLSPIMVALSVCIGPEMARAAESSKVDPNRIIQDRGPIPVLGQEYWGTTVELKFELYRSSDGGSPFWKEMRRGSVDKEGWVKIDLGEVARLPDEAFTPPFRFLAIWQGKVEFAPRKQVASLAYVASSLDEQILPSTTSASEKKSVKASKAAVTDAAEPLGKLVDCGTIFMEMNPRAPGTWFKAMETAAQLKTRLPTFEEWYGAYDGKSRG